MKNKNLNETASGGAIGTGGIAVRLDGKIIDGKERRRLQDFLRSFNKKVTNRYKYKPVKPFPISVNESFDIQDVLSRLRGLEDHPSARQDSVTYGVEDDEGNVMKVSVRADQATEFETTLGHELADMKAFSITGQSGKDVSMAELLFNLKDKFDIIDVQFPKIPDDVVYNADDASFNVPDTELDDEVGDDDMGSDLGPNDPMDLENMEDIEGDEMGGELAPGDDGGMGGLEGDMEDVDAEGVEDFVEPTESSEGSILDRVLDMLKAQAEAERAKAEAAAEESRAKQAEYSARAAAATIEQEEEIARMEAEMERQKDEEKQARKLADIAKYRVSKASGLRESDDLETVAMVRRAMSQVANQYRFEHNPNISDEENNERRQYLAQQKANKMRELQARMRSARTREIYAAQAKRKQNQQRNQQQQQQNQQNQDNQAGNQQGGNQGNENI